MAVRALLTKREISADNKKTSEAQRPAAKPQAKPKIKATAKPTKAKATVRFTKELSDDQGGSDKSQTR